MKNLLMTLLFLSGLAATNLDAQSCCLPSPPNCCVKSCCEKDKAAKADAKACKTEATTTCTPAQLEACKAAGKQCVVAPAEASKQVKAISGQPQAPDKNPAKQVALVQGKQ